MNRLLTTFAVACFFVLFIYMNNKWLIVSEYEIQSERIPANFSGLKIAHLSDLHDASFGKNQEAVIKKIENVNPDLIFFTGDIIDSNRFNLNKSLQMIDGLVHIAPVYYVTGNHEIATNQVAEITQQLKAHGVNVLQNNYELLERDSETLVIGGIDDPLMRVSELQQESIIVTSNIEKTFHNLDNQSAYILLLSHRPEFMDVYTEKEIDLVFSGHAHGGQIRLPFVGGLIAPGQGWFPSYTSGVYTSQQTNMVVSRGLGNSIIPIRMFNFPEIIVITLKNK